ncbi:MAG: PglZ domain-containing protein, partial [Actinomycetota bacterium]|nr:PglZ domain-containing protein [Actinomycetota bacterium]
RRGWCSLGAVSDHLRGLVERQVKDHGLVVWFDPEEHYREFAGSLSLPETAIEVCGESFFELRHRIEPHLSADGDLPPRLVVYVPKSEEETRDALVELTAPGVVMKPRQQPRNRNTRLSVVAKTALRPVLGDEQAAKVEKDVIVGKYALTDLDKLTEGRPGVLSLIFGAAYPQEVALKFLGSTRYDSDLVAREAVPDLASLLGGAFGVSLSGDDSCEELRIMLARHVLSTEFVRSISGPLPPQLSFVKVANEDAAAEACTSLAHEWRNRRDLKESYAEHADRVEGELGLSRMSFGMEQISGCETFAGVELALQTAVEERALSAAKLTPEEHRELRELIERRLQGFWASWPERYGQIQPRWLLVQAAVEVIHAAGTIEGGLKTLDGNPETVLKRYAGNLSAEEPWCDLDTHHRSLERRDLDFARGIGDEYPALEKLVVRARQRYREAGEALSEHYLRALQKAKFQVSGVPRQTEIYAIHIAPVLSRGGKVAYVLVDSLRYEMARDLARRLQDDYEVDLYVALGTIPTITEIGMAALMPGAESGAKVVPVSAGRLGLKVGDTVLSGRQDRVKYLEKYAERASRSVYETKLEDLLYSPKKTKPKVKGADLVFVTSQEIDEQGELGNIAAARRFMDEVLSMLPRAIKVLADLGCDTIVLAADHGYLFADELGPDTKIDPPGGQEADLHRRAWVGVGGSDEPSFLRAPLSRLGFGEGLDVAVPWGFGAFKSPGGATAYFHGGMSPQEMAIPVLSLKTKRAADATSSADIDWELGLNSKKISTRFVTVLVGGRPASLFEPALPRVRVEVRIGGTVVSEPVAATYDFSDTALDIGLRLADNGEIETNTITLMVDPDVNPQARSGTASVHLLNATTGVELARKDGVEMDISV